MKSDDYIKLTETFSTHNYSPLEVVLERGQGAWVWDVEGKKYLDMLTAYSALSFGHCNPRIVAAAQAQMQKMTLISRAFYNDQLALFSKELAELCGMDLVLLMNSGAEAVETAIKAARRWGYTKKKVKADSAEIITFEGNFHGRTTTIVGFSTSASSKENFGPFTPGFVSVPYGDLEAVKRAITPNTVAVLFEPIQGEGGIIIPPTGFIKGLKELSLQHKFLLLADEIQSGLCRTGELFACDHEGVKPDAYIVAKALGGGILPVSAVVGSSELMSVFTPGSHGSTFGGNPLACAVGREVLNIIREERPQQRAKEMGEYFLSQLKTIKSKKVAAFRGRGLLIGVDISPSYGKAKKVCSEFLREGILCKDTREQTIRFAPPLNIDKADLDWGIERIRKVLGDSDLAGSAKHEAATESKAFIA
ncbi:MAG: ornithine--oxo-acid transaminase [Proteobacteria bacterium]|nr:MAG: ornithine--oxo-acid transaminase [Pseudomonadota bacterium]